MSENDRLIWRVPLVPPNLLNRRMHFRVKRRLQETWKDFLLVSGIATGMTPLQVANLARHRARGRVCEVHIGRHCSHPTLTAKTRVEIAIHHIQQFDPDGLRAACKIPLDALKEMGFIADDSEDFITLEVTQVRVHRKTQQQTIIALEAE